MMTTSTEHVWKLTSQRAQLTAAGLAGCLDLAQPQAGLRLTRLLGEDVTVSCFAVEVPSSSQASVSDAFARSETITVHYKETTDTQLRTELTYRLVSLDRQQVTLDQLVSAQTSSLDSSPSVTVSFALPLGDLLSWTSDGRRQSVPAVSATTFTNGALLLRDTMSGLTWALLTHAVDVVDVILSKSDSATQVDIRLFPDRIEKGVIRRTQIGLLACRSDKEDAVLEQAYQRFVSSPPPLS